MANVKRRSMRGIKTAPVGEAVITKFCDLVILHGKSHTEAYLLSHPDCTSTSNGAVRQLAYLFSRREDVIKRMEDIREDMRQRNAAFRDRLIAYHVRDIDRTVEEEGSLTNCMDQVRSVSKILGLEQTKVAVEAKVGALDDSAVADKIAFLAGKAAIGK